MIEINLRRMNEYNNYNRGIAMELREGNQITAEEEQRIFDIIEELEQIYGKIKSQNFADAKIIGINHDPYPQATNEGDAL